MTPLTPFTQESDAITYVFESLAQSNWRGRGLDEHTRDITPTKKLLAALGLPAKKREYAVVTGSKGKGSVSLITAKILEALGHRVGLVTSPHLTTYRQRFRINGLMMSEAELLRLIHDMRPEIESVKASLREGTYLSPQGIFLAAALKWFDEQNVTIAVIEVGRGGRFDDNAIVPNMLSLFAPILLEHRRYLGDSIERIAWHKAGIIKPHSFAYSLPQTPEALTVLQAEADAKDAKFEWLAPAHQGHWLEDLPDGQRVDFGRYGIVEFPMLGRYEIANASLAIWGAGNIHARLDSPIKHGMTGYVERVRNALSTVFWPGRCERLSQQPDVYVDGAINPQSADSFIESVKGRLTSPVITVLAVPTDRDMDAVYQRFAKMSDSLILTTTARNVTIHFPTEAEALQKASAYHHNVSWVDSVAQAIEEATRRAGQDGTVLLALAQPAIGDAMAYYGRVYEQI
jgi:dihydrofolate synthase/folylpolyglutamate synthase